MAANCLELAQRKASVANLDDAHTELVDLCLRIEWACGHDASIADIRERIRTFMMYARWHFSDEEIWMRELRYPDHVAHAAEHARLLQDAHDFVESFGGALQRDDGPAIASYFRFWMHRHVSDRDLALRAFIQCSA